MCSICHSSLSITPSLLSSYWRWDYSRPATWLNTAVLKAPPKPNQQPNYTPSGTANETGPEAARKHAEAQRGSGRNPQAEAGRNQAGSALANSPQACFQVRKHASACMVCTRFCLTRRYRIQPAQGRAGFVGLLELGASAFSGCKQAARDGAGSELQGGRRSQQSQANRAPS